MTTPPENKPFIERIKGVRPKRAVRRRIVQLIFVLLSLFLLAETVGVILRLGGVSLLV
jgi:hypothetical protein